MRQKKLKLAYICPWFSTEYKGPLYNLLEEISKSVDVVCITSKQKYVQYYNREEQHAKHIEIINKNFRIRYFNFRSLPHDTLFPIDLKKILDKEKPDIVQSDEFFRFSTIQAASWCKKSKVPFILNSRMRYRPGFLRSLVLFGFKILAKSAVKQADFVIATQGKCSEDEFLRWFPEKKKTLIIPTGLNIKSFLDRKKVDNFRKKYKLPSNKKIILEVARIYPVKRIDLLIKIFATVKKAYPSILVIVGPAENKEKTKIEALINDLNLVIGDDIIFTGPILNNELAPAYASASVFVNTSETEGICFSFLEAMAFKLPIVTFNVGGNSGVIQQGVNGYLTDFGDIKNFAEKIVKILKDDTLRKRLGEDGYKKLKHEFNIKKNAIKQIEIYKSLCK